MSKPASRRVVTGEARLSYANLWEPRSINGGPEKYSTAVLIPKTDTDTIQRIEAAIGVAVQEGVAKFGAKFPTKASMLKLPLRDGDTDRDDPVYEGHFFVNANSKTQPQIVDAQVQPILDQAEVYSGVYGRVSLEFYAFDTNGNRGIACGLGNIQKLRDGEPLSGGATAADDFGAPVEPNATGGYGGFTGAAAAPAAGGDDFLA